MSINPYSYPGFADPSNFRPYSGPSPLHDTYNDPFVSGISDFIVGTNNFLSSPLGSYLYPLPSLISRYGTDILDSLGSLPYPEDLVASLLGSDDSGSNPSPGGYYPSPSAKQIDYLYADLSKYYGMDRETAYNEAMANTAYQRAVADMQLAGLNPASLFSAGRAASAPVVHGSSSGGFSSGKGAADNDQLPGWIYYGAQAAAYAFGGPKASIVASLVMKALNGI